MDGANDGFSDYRVEGYMGSVSDVLRKSESTLAEFAWHFANDGSKLHGDASLRSNGRGYPVPRSVELHPTYQQRVEEARAEVDRLEAITPKNVHDTRRLNVAAGEWLLAAKAAYDQVVASRERVLDRGRRMIEAIDAWSAPDILADMKEAMKKAILQGTGQWTQPPEPSMPADLIAWHDRRLALARRNLSRVMHDLDKEIAKIKKLNAWLEAMYAAFGEPVPYEESGESKPC